mmetsp:Transcript_1821/g.6193  ORF Transcript_1821/g.6193 Transcript_1821/m.6193 type:complete len:316 (+) Transcript_1821:3142-4089(+)
MDFNAKGPWPCPRETTSTFVGTSGSPGLAPGTFTVFDSANVKRLAIGSEPGERINTRGTPGEESWKHAPKSNGVWSTNEAPSSAPTYSVMAGTTLSGRNARTRSILCSGVNCVLNGAGSVSLCGSFESYSTFHRDGSLVTSAGTSPFPQTLSIKCMRSSSPQVLSEIHSGAGFGSRTSPVLIPPVRKKRNSSDSMPSLSSPSCVSGSCCVWSSSTTPPSFSSAENRGASSSSPRPSAASSVPCELSAASAAISSRSASATVAASNASRFCSSSCAFCAASSASTSSPFATRASRISATRFSSAICSRAAFSTAAA